MFSSICKILRILVSACSMITLRHSLLMQPHHFAIAYLRLYPYSKKLFMGKSCVVQLSSLALIFVLWDCKGGSYGDSWSSRFLPLASRFLSLASQIRELLTNNIRSLIRDSNKISKHAWVIKNDCQVWVELYRKYKRPNNLEFHVLLLIN